MKKRSTERKNMDDLKLVNIGEKYNYNKKGITLINIVVLLFCIIIVYGFNIYNTITREITNKNIFSTNEVQQTQPNNNADELLSKRKILEDNSLVVKKNGVFNTSIRIVSTKEITNDGYNKFKEQVLNFVDRDGVAKEPKLIPKENIFLNMDIYLMNLLGVIIVTILCMFVMKSITRRLELNEE